MYICSCCGECDQAPIYYILHAFNVSVLWDGGFRYIHVHVQGSAYGGRRWAHATTAVQTPTTAESLPTTYMYIHAQRMSWRHGAVMRALLLI